MRQIVDGNIRATSKICQIGRIFQLKQVKNTCRGIVGMKKLAQRLSGAPDDNFRCFVYLCFVKTTDKRR